MKLNKLRGALFQGDVGKVLRGMSTLALGTGVARLIGVVSMPIVARIYSPDDFGVLAVYAALVAILAPFLTLRYVIAIPLPRQDATAANIVVLSGAIICVTSSFVGAALWAQGELLLGWLSMDVLSAWRPLIVAGAMIVALYELAALWATRQRAYGIMSSTKVIQALLAEGTKLALGLLGAKPFGLLIGSVVEQGGGLTRYLSKFKGDVISNAGRIKRKHLLFVTRRYVSFPLLRLPSQVLLVFASQAPALFSAALFGAQAAGQLGLALMALAIPSNLIGQAVGQAFYGEIAKLKRSSEVRIKDLVFAVQKRLFAISIPAALAIAFLGEQIFSVAFGSAWSDAGRFAAILAPFVLLQLTSAPLVQVLNVYNKQGAFLAINVFRTIGLLGIYTVCSKLRLSETVFVSLLSGFLFLFYLVITLYILLVVVQAAKPRLINPPDRE